MGEDRRRPGRPKEFDGTPVSVRLPKDLHDALSREALRRDERLSDLIRKRLSVPYPKTRRSADLA